MERWDTRAACRGLPTEMFFVAVGEQTPPMLGYNDVCGVCPVRDECLDEGLANHEYRFGAIRGRLLPKQQRKIMKQRILSDGVYITT